MVIFFSIVVIGALSLMFMTMVFDSNPFEGKNALGEAVIKLLEDKGGWEFDRYNARLGGLEMWTANRPYADLTIEGIRIGNMWQRREIRRLLDERKAQAIINLANQIKKHAKK